MEVFNFGFTELLVIIFFILIIFKPKDYIQILRSIINFIDKVKRYLLKIQFKAEGIKEEILNAKESELEDIKKVLGNEISSSYNYMQDEISKMVIDSKEIIMKKMNIVLLAAMEEEIEHLKEVLSEGLSKEYHLDRVFYKSTYEGFNIIFTKSGIGKVNSAISATLIATKYNPEAVIFTGIAGSLNKNLKPLDGVIGSKLIQYDFDLTAFSYDLGQVPDMDTYLKSNSALVEKAYKSAENLFANYKKGIIASGDRFVNDSKFNNFLSTKFSADAVEMEGASVGQVLTQAQIPYVILRVISDGADGSGKDTYQDFIKKSSELSNKWALETVKLLKLDMLVK